jgi:RNase P subunit RPR2
MSKESAIAEQVVSASAETIKRIVCFKCGGPLNIQFTEVGNGGLSVMCPKCV